MIPVCGAAQVRSAEAALMRTVPEGTLMQRAAFGLAVEVSRALRDCAGGVVGRRVVCLIGTGNNGGDALYAGALLAGRGAHVVAIPCGDRVHAGGSAALRRAGGRLVREDEAGAALAGADLVLDGIVGIGARGPLRGSAERLVRDLPQVPVVAVDVPSGVDADSGTTPGAAVAATLSVTFGVMKPGLLLMPGRASAGEVRLVDIGLGPWLEHVRTWVLDSRDVVPWAAAPAQDAYKYSRGVALLDVGSDAYTGAALLGVGGARAADIGMVIVAGPVADRVVSSYPDVVVAGSQGVGAVRRVNAALVGPGLGRDAPARARVQAALELPVPLVIDADALHLVTAQDIRTRSQSGAITVLTPHDGEFRALGWQAGPDRLASARAAAADLGCVVVLKGPGTVVATPSGTAYIDAHGTAALGTAGSGDVLAGLITGTLARQDPGDAAGPSVDAAALAAAAAVWLHSAAGRRLRGPVHAPDLPPALRAVVAELREGCAA